MSPNEKLYSLASADATLQADLGGTPPNFRWYEKQVKQGSAYPCVRVLLVTTGLMYEQRGLNPMTTPRFQIDVLDKLQSRARTVADDIIKFLATVSLAQSNDFDSPKTTPPQFPNFLINRREGMDSAEATLQPPIHVHTLDVRLYNLEAF